MSEFENLLSLGYYPSIKSVFEFELWFFLEQLVIVDELLLAFGFKSIDFLDY